MSAIYLLMYLSELIVQCAAIAGTVIAALSWRDRRAARKAVADGPRRVEQRLRDLEALRDRGAIDLDEHQRQRQAIIAAV